MTKEIVVQAYSSLARAQVAHARNIIQHTCACVRPTSFCAFARTAQERRATTRARKNGIEAHLRIRSREPCGCTEAHAHARTRESTLRHTCAYVRLVGGHARAAGVVEGGLAVERLREVGARRGEFLLVVGNALLDARHVER